MMQAETITVVVQQQTTALAIAVTLASSLVAIAIAVGSAFRDNRVRQREKTDREADRAAEEERRALRDAHKVVWTYTNLDEGTGCITIINAGSGPILDLAIFSARFPDGTNIRWVSNADFGADTPVLLAGSSHDFPGSWMRMVNGSWAPIDDEERPTQGILCELHWRDDTGHVWDTDNEFAQPRLGRIIGDDELRA